MHFFQEEFKATHILALKKMDALRAAVEAVKVDAWQDISTAPVCVASEGSNNGRKPVLVTRWPVTGRHHPVAVARLTRNGWMSGKRGTSLWFEPTHWMPLPKPPGDTA
jgi:hypothetical protein